MTVTEILKQYFGYDSLRPGQEKLISGILERRDVLGIMPTGAGKSICYQIPALMFPGITLVISPLISLMADQVKALNQAGVHAAYINSSLTETQIAKALQFAREGRYKIIYVAPERLLTSRFLDFAQNQTISMVAVDEAHCISQWGQDFRPSYMDIRTFVEMLAERPVVSAFTATATERVRRDIESALGLIQPEVMVTGFDRPNLYFRVAQRKGGAATDNAVLNYLANHEGESGIIYCATKKNVDNLFELLLARGISAGRYHAGMSSEERKQSQEDFTFDRITVMVATNAFGMGIDKSNVRFVLHYNMPQSLENYYQEAGRAGRDGEYGECVLFYSKQDIMINKYLLNSITGTEMMTEEEIRTVRNNSFRKLNKMIDYCETDRCLRGMILEYFGEEAPEDCGNCSNCVPVLETEEANLLGKKKKAGKSFLGGELSEVQRQLFEELREVRSVLASREKVPPYVICGDKTLADMCVKLPEGETALLEVYGMGQKKAENYGEDFLDAIRNFRMFHEMTAEVPAAPAEPGMTEEAEPRKKEKKVKLPFRMEEEQWNSFPYKETMIVRDMANLLNELKGDNGTARISAIQINQILVEQGYLSNTEVDGKSVKRVTEKGFDAGILEEERKDRQGNTYYALSHSRKAQEAIIRELRNVFK